MQHTLLVPVSDFDEECNEQLTSYSNPVVEISDEIERVFQNYSPKTVIAYKTDLHNFWSFTGKPFQNTVEDDVLKYIKSLEQRGYKNSSINRKVASLSKVMSIYVSKGLMKYHPIHNLASIGKLYKSVEVGVYKTITSHDVEAVVSHARSKTAVVVKFLANTGIRVSELTGIMKEDLEPFNTEFMRIKIRGKGGKIRFVFISYDLYKDVKTAYPDGGIYMFASNAEKQLSRTNLYTQISRAFSLYAHKENIGPHTLRHYWATQKIVEEKKDYKAVSKYLGHASPAITMQYYVDSQLSPEETILI